jgi:hypothetical protein
MSYVFIDESGDLGFDFKKKKTSKFFVVTFIFSKDKNGLDKIVKKVFKSFTRSNIKNHTGVLHANKENPKTRYKLLNLFHDNKCGDVIIIYLNKNQSFAKL